MCVFVLCVFVCSLCALCVSGTLPNDLAALPHLSALFLGGNLLTALPTLPFSPQLIQLDVSFNRITSLPPWMPTPGSMANVQELSLNDNLISSDISALQLSAFQNNATKPKSLSIFIANNLLAGSLSPSFCTFDPRVASDAYRLVNLDAHNNAITGGIPSLHACTQLLSVDLR